MEKVPAAELDLAVALAGIANTCGSLSKQCRLAATRRTDEDAVMRPAVMSG
jgi:hypothetical protein